MSIQTLPSGKYRAQVYDPTTGGNVGVGKILGGKSTFVTKREAKIARERARASLGGQRLGPTVAEFRHRWLTDPLFGRGKESTMRHNAERTQAFVAKYGALPMDHVGDEIVGEWLAGGNRASTIPALRAMWNDAASAKAGRLVQHNPWANLHITRGSGNRYKQPPTEEQVWAIISQANQFSGPHFSAWLQVAAFTGLRPGELDALRWSRIDFKQNRIRVAEQFNAATKGFTSPKNGKPRDALLTPPAREALLTLPRDGDYCFVNLRGDHWTPSARAYHWKAVRAAAGWTGSLYLATRHFAGWYMVNVLEMPSEDVAIALGHEDGGELVRKLYGHRDKERALARVQAAYESTGNVKPLRVVEGSHSHPLVGA